MIMWLVVSVWFCCCGSVISQMENLVTHCSANAFDKKSLNKQDDWLKLGQFYSFCMQYNNIKTGKPSEFDENCRTNDCKECIRPCTIPRPVNLQTCLMHCNSSQSCIDRCNFYVQLYGGSAIGSPYHIDPDNAPVITYNYVYIDHIEDSYVSLAWPIATCLPNSEIASVYLLALEVVTPWFNETIVIGLTTKLHYDVSLDDICFAKSGYRVSPRIARLIIQPINFHGWVKGEKLYSNYFAFKKVPAVRNLAVKGPPVLVPARFPGDTERLRWDVTWECPEGNVFPTVEIKTIVRSCRSNVNFQAIFVRQPVIVREVPIDSGTYIEIVNTEKDYLKGCTIEVRVTTFQGNCLRGEFAIVDFEYQGCETVVGGTCPPPVITPPSGEAVENRSLQLVQSRCLSCNNSTCVNGTHTINVTWERPSMSPVVIEAIKIVWGALSSIPTPLGEQKVILSKDVIDSVDVSPSTTSFIITSIPSTIRELAVLIQPLEKSNDPVRLLKIDYYATMTLPDVQCSGIDQ